VGVKSQVLEATDKVARILQPVEKTDSILSDFEWVAVIQDFFLRWDLGNENVRSERFVTQFLAFANS
jgi:hypothetical protein